MSSKISSQADSQMPWDLLKGDTMKAIFKDLGLNQYVGKREDMLERLQEVEKDGRMYEIRFQEVMKLISLWEI